MNTRYFFPPESLCNSGSAVSFSNLPLGEGRLVVGPRHRPSRALPPSSFLVRMAVRISRARWFSFLRRVFHYQNGSRSDLGNNPFNSSTWMLLEFIALIIQMSITSFTLAVSKTEKPVWPMRIWIVGYDIGCVLSLLLLYGRYRHLHLSQGDGFSLSDMEQQRGSEESRISHLMNKCRTSLELFFAIWFVMGNVWVFDSRFGSFTRAPKLHVLCISLLAWNAICYSFPFLLFLLLCCCVPLISNFVGYNMNMGSTEKGASDDQISQLPSWRYKKVDGNLELGNDTDCNSELSNEDPECCICLAKYKDKEELSQVQKPPHIAMVPTPGMGHLIPLVELAKKLVLHHHFFVTFIIPTDGSPIKSQKAVLESLPNAISYIFLPPVSFDDLPKDVRPETLIVLTLTRSLPALRDSFKVLAESTRLVALVVDLFGVDAFDVAKEFGALSYIFFPTNALSLSLMFHIPELDETYSCEYKELPEPVKLPGCVPVQGIDILDPIQDKKNDTYKRVLHVAKRYPFADGIMVNSFMDLEPSAFKALMEGAKEGKPPVYPIGPLIQSGLSRGVDGSECLNWLDKQPERSVLYVSFGSGGTLTHEQLNELALGLELSGQRFLWVVRSPHENASANYFSVQSFKDPLDFLPKGFLERTKEVGLVVPSWAPQAQVLSHGSTGGFLSHCGWNSILESIVHGVPIIAWPLYAEQRMNAVLLSDDLKVALRVKVNDKGLVGHKDIANYARGLIEGEEGKLLRNKMKELKDSAAKALSQDGSSTKSLAEVTQLWKSHKK